LDWRFLIGGVWMSSFRRVEMQHAGPSAIGILIPLGQPTVVVIRPRAVPWDLRPARWNGDSATPPVMCQFDRDEAAVVARQFIADLENSVAAGRDPIEICRSLAGREFQVWVRIGDLLWIAGQRVQGQAYRPAVFASEAEALAVGKALLPYLWPAAAGQQYYFNTQLFSSTV
jgi:hypothetical protein